MKIRIMYPFLALYNILKLLINNLNSINHLLLEINMLILNKTDFTSRFAFLKSHDQKTPLGNVKMADVEE